MHQSRTPKVGGLWAVSRRVIAFYRLQAQLAWEWRPTRLAILRRTVLTYLAACLALAITAGVLSGLTIGGLGPLLLAALLLLALDTISSVVLHWLLVPWPIFVAQALGLVIQIVAILMLGRVLPGTGVDAPATAGWAAVLLTTLNSLFAELVAVSDDDSYYGVLVRRLVARDFGREAEPTPGLLVVQIDGLSLPILRNALRAGRAPVLEQRPSIPGPRRCRPRRRPVRRASCTDTPTASPASAGMRRRAAG